jgi:hypothetical protein
LRVFDWYRIAKPPVIILLLAGSLLCQNQSVSLYARGVQACLEKESEFLKTPPHGESEVIISYDEDLTRELPTQLGPTKIKYLNNRELAEKYVRTQKNQRQDGIAVIKIFPLYDKDGKLFFAFNNYSFSYSEKGGFFSKKKLFYRWALGGGCHAEIGFDASSQKFIIEKVELWGV